MPVALERPGPGVAHLRLDRPEALNAIDPEMNRALIERFLELRDDDGVRVVLLSASGDRAFCAGVDVKRMDALYGAVPADRRRERWNRDPGVGGITRNLDPGKPVIAAIHGYCLGGGLELALACDLRIASPDAVFGLPEVTLGIIPGQGGTQRLPRTVPLPIALEMILTGARIPAERALAVGLVNRVVPRSDLLPVALALARTIAELPPRAVRTAREAVRRGLALPLDEGLRLEQDLADPLRDSEESRASRAAFAARGDRA